MNRIRRVLRATSWMAWAMMLAAAMTITAAGLFPEFHKLPTGLILVWPVIAAFLAFYEGRADRTAKDWEQVARNWETGADKWQAIADGWQSIAVGLARTQVAAQDAVAEDFKEDGP